MRLGVFTIGQAIDFYDFRLNGDLIQPDYSTWIVQGYCYPGGMYSPVGIFGNDKYWIGDQLPVSVPGLQARRACMMIVSPGGDAAKGEGGRGWLYEYRLSEWGDEDGLRQVGVPGQAPAQVKARLRDLGARDRQGARAGRHADAVSQLTSVRPIRAPALRPRSASGGGRADRVDGRP
ncbi:MAG: hypothetical protein V9F04_01170 [Dermatophilaceae bacterium]